MLVALQLSTFAFQQTDRGGFPTPHTHRPWSDSPTLPSHLFWSECNQRMLLDQKNKMLTVVTTRK